MMVRGRYGLTPLDPIPTFRQEAPVFGPVVIFRHAPLPVRHVGGRVPGERVPGHLHGAGRVHPRVHQARNQIGFRAQAGIEIPGELGRGLAQADQGFRRPGPDGGH